MGHKVACLECRKAFNIGTDFTNHVSVKCPNCGSSLAIFNHKFRPPKSSDTKAWQVVKFLYDHGFNYQHIEEEIMTNRDGLKTDSGKYVAYPTNMKDALEFVAKYKSQSNENSG